MEHASWILLLLPKELHESKCCSVHIELTLLGEGGVESEHVFPNTKKLFPKVSSFLLSFCNILYNLFLNDSRRNSSKRTLSILSQSTVSVYVYE